MVVAELAYLGEVITAGGTFASLRDLADYGAALAFDDAESLSDRRTPTPTSAPTAGRQPARVRSRSRNWQTTGNGHPLRERLLPPAVLSHPHAGCGAGPRTIVIPLIRTADRDKAKSIRWITISGS